MTEVQGHAIHFLERLGRADEDQAELALRLYHDPDALRFVLSRVRVPNGIERVAVSLHEADQGPYIVATRAGRFVTCLGRGMSITDLHPVPHGQLLALMQKKEDQRERLDLARSLVGQGRETVQLVGRLRTRGDALTREEVSAILALQPALKLTLLLTFVETASSFTGLCPEMIAIKRFRGRRDASLLKRFWNLHHAVGHLALLFAADGPRGLERFFQPVGPGSETGAEIGLRLAGMTGDIGLLARVAWAAGKLGKVALPACRRLLMDPPTTADWLIGLTGAMVIGLRHGKARAEVEKTIKRLFAIPPQDWPAGPIRLVGLMDPERFISLIEEVLVDPEATHGRYLRAAKRLVLTYIEALDAPPEYRFGDAADIPDDLALSVFANLRGNALAEPPTGLILLSMTPWLARCELEDFYLPSAARSALGVPWSPVKGERLVQDVTEAWGGLPEPVRAAPEPGRNDPCPCGSGLKYKKCCLGKGERG